MTKGLPTILGAHLLWSDAILPDLNFRCPNAEDYRALCWRSTVEPRQDDECCTGYGPDVGHVTEDDEAKQPRR